MRIIIVVSSFSNLEADSPSRTCRPAAAAPSPTATAAIGATSMMKAGSNLRLSISMFLNGFRISTGTPTRASMVLNSAGIFAVPPERKTLVKFASAAVPA